MNSLAPFLMQWVGQFPVLLLNVFGLMLAVLFWRRCPLPCLLTLIANGLFLAVTVVPPLVTHILLQGPRETGLMLGVVLVSSIFRAVAFGLLLAAVFVGRREAPRAEPGQVL